MIELRERIASLPPEKLKRLEQVLRQRAAKPQIEETIPRSGNGPHRLSFAQERLWFIEQLEPADGAYNLAWALRLRGPLRVDVLQRALDATVARQAALRTVFREVEGVPYQFVEPPRSVEMRRFDLTDHPANPEISAVLSEEAHRSFDLGNDVLLRSALLRLGQDEHVLLLTLHHIAADGWSRGILLREIGDYYRAFTAGTTLSVPELPIGYADFAQWQRRWLDEGPQEAQLAYWKQRLAGTPTTLDIPTDFPRPSTQTYRGAREILALDEDLPERLNTFSRNENVTLFMLLLAAFETLLHRYTGETDIVVGTPVANRQRVETEGLIGYFVNTVAMRVDFSGNQSSGEPTFREMLRRVREATLGAYGHQDVPFEKVIDTLKPTRQRSHSPIFQVLFVLLNAPRETFTLPGLSAEIVEVETGATQFDLVVEVVERPDQTVLRLAYRTDLFQGATARRMLGNFQTLLRAAVQNPDETISRLPLLTGPERQELLDGWNQTARDYPDLCTHQWFERQAANTPGAIAAAQGDRQWTYAELSAKSNGVASHLKKLGVKSGALVAVCVERSLESIAGLLGIWKVGAAYLPLDPSYPEQRLAYILEDARPAVILTELHLRDHFQSSTIPIAWLEDGCNESDADPAAGASAPSLDDLAYVIYTSGSTGKPKGVAIRHGSLTNLLNAMSGRLGATPNDILLAVTTISFDIAGLELFLPLVTGGRVAIVSREIASDGSRLARAIDESGATTMQGTPATWEMLLDIGWSPKKGLKMVCGGDAMPAAVAERLKANGLLWNVYGPTETTIWSTMAKVDTSRTGVSIGRPLDNTELYVLDRHRQPVPIGVPGELYIGGAGLAQGYWNHPELTAERFVPHPFKSSPGARLYRTGDLVRYLADGNVDFLGRVDNQVKIRGFRIELGEIETVLGRHAAVGRCVVVAQECAGDKRLVAYFESVAESAPDSAHLRAYLKQELPDHMIPSAFVRMDRVPLTPNGKIDRKALPAPSEQRLESAGGFVAPRDPLEHALAQAWGRILRIQPVGIHDDFFELGGHSLAAMRLVFEVQKVTGKALPLATLFRASTIAALAEILRADGWSPSWSSLVPIQPAGPKSPLFLIHGAEGNILLYRQVTRHLGPDQPIYGLQSQGLNGDATLGVTVQDMAAHYVKEIATVQPQGPYFLGGYCLGGIIAYEMAQQLTAQGQKVELVIMLDTYNSCYVNRSISVAQRPWHFLQKIWFHAANALSLPSQGRWKFLGEKAAVASARLKIRLGAAYDRIRNMSTPGSAARYPHMLIGERNDRAADEYIPRPYAGRVTVIRSKAHFAGLDSASLGWSECVTGELEIHELPVYPKGMLVEPFCELLAAALKECLPTALKPS
jgi:amino acid adenylation domain-containing protein